MKLIVNNYFPIVCLAGSLLLTADAFAAAVDDANPAVAARARDAVAYPVTELTFRYVEAFPSLPTARELGDTEVPLVRVADGFAGPRDGVETEAIRLNSIGSDGEVLLYASAVDAIAEALRNRLENQFSARFFVAADPRHIDAATGADLRRPRQRALGFKIEYTGSTYQIDGFELN